MMSIIKYSILIFFGLLFYNLLIADNTFPLSYKEIDYHEGGNLYVIKSDVNNNYLSFLIKPNWYQTEPIFYWNGIKRKNAIGSYFSGKGQILSALPINNAMIILWKESHRFFLSKIDTTLNFKNQPYELFINDDLAEMEVHFYKINNTSFLLQTNSSLFLCEIKNNDFINSTLISNNVSSTNVIKSKNGDNFFAYVENIEGNGFLTIYDNNATKLKSERFDIFDYTKIFQYNNDLIVITSPNLNEQTLVHVVDKDNIKSSTWIDAHFNNFQIINNNTNSTIYYINENNNNYYLNINSLFNIINKKDSINIKLPVKYIEPIKLEQSSDTIVSLFRNGFIVYDINGNILAQENFHFADNFNNAIISISDNFLIISSNLASVSFNKEQNTFWYINKFIQNIGKYILVILLIIMVIIFIQLYRHQKRQFNLILDLPSSGYIFFIDNIGRLKNTNSQGMKLLGINRNVPLNNIYKYYFNTDETKPLCQFIEKGLLLKTSIAQKYVITINKELKEINCKIIPINNFAGKLRSIILICIDVTEDTERGRLGSWAQLAHDMQTNLTTIRLNAEQLTINDNIDNEKRKIKIIYQTLLLIQRVRDLVTVGRSDQIELQTVLSQEICSDVLLEFDESMYPNVKLINQADAFKINCDKPKFQRALRNAIENAIRSLPENTGTITLKCWKELNHAYFSVIDTGIGMDENTQKNILKPYFTTSKKYGGMGIGTMIMQHVTELHGGKLVIKSEKNHGTEVTFVLPNYISK